MDFATQPVDPTSAAALAAQDLRLGLVDRRDREALAAWFQADARGFYASRLTDEQLDVRLEHAAHRRATGVWDAGSADPLIPVATVSTWPAALTVPATASSIAPAPTIDAWAIASVTVAPTHRRRGVARALLEAELRTAHRLGMPLAMLTVSEATIYGRFGFAPAAFVADLTIDTRRVQWSGPRASGILHFIGIDELREQARLVYEAARRTRPGEIELDSMLWEALIGALGEGELDPKNLRAVRYDDDSGVAQGFVLYRVAGGESDFTMHTVHVLHLSAATDEAYAALWRYVLELDLVATVEAPLRSVDEPVLWMVGDRRAARVRHADHLWLRILDLGATLTARGYASPGRIALDVADPLGFAEARVLLTVGNDGRGTVEPLTSDVPADAAHLALNVGDLAGLYLGGTHASTLVRAGRVTELRPSSADAMDAAFRSPRTPWLSTWF